MLVRVDAPRATVDALTHAPRRGCDRTAQPRAADGSQTASTTSRAATAKRPGRLERRRMAAPGRDDHRERNEPDGARAGAARARRRRAAARSSAARRSGVSASDAAIATTKAVCSSPPGRATTTPASSREPDGEPDRARNRPKAGRGRAPRCTGVRVVADRVLEPTQELRIVGEAREADHGPRRERAARRRSRREHGAAATRRVAASQTTSGQRKNFAASVTPIAAPDRSRRARGTATRPRQPARARASRCRSGSPRSPAATGAHP